MIQNMCSDFVENSMVNDGVARKVRVINIPTTKFVYVTRIVSLNVFNVRISHRNNGVSP
jgi:hypothetical protein